MATELSHETRAPSANWIVGFVLGLLCLIYVFFISLSTGFAWLYGDSADALIEVAILEHWHNVFAGSDTWNITGYFYPNPDTLGYNDTYFLSGIEYSLARGVLDPLLATVLTHATLKLVGFAGMIMLLRRVLGANVRYALIGAALFTCANASVMQMWHGQLNYLGIVPWFLSLLLFILRAVEQQDRGKALRYGALSALTYGAWALSAFYFVWFTTLFVIITSAILLLFGGRDALTRAFMILRANMITLAMICGMFVVALVPFLTVYVPHLVRGEQHAWDMIRAGLPDPVTFFNVGGGNLLWGKAFIVTNDRFFPSNDIGLGDIVGFPLITLLFTLTASFWFWRNRSDPTARLILSSLFAVAVILLLMLRIPGVGSAWKLVFHFVPGGGSIRQINRFLIFVTIIQFATLALWLSRAVISPAVKLGIVIVLFVEQIQLAPPVYLSRPQTLTMLEEVSSLPASCKSIFVMSGRTNDQLRSDAATLPWSRGETLSQHAKSLASFDEVYRRNVDAMLIASVLQRPTINGYASFLPPDWNFLTRSRPEMIDVARRYAGKHGLTGVCALDRTKSEWWITI